MDISSMSEDIHLKDYIDVILRRKDAIILFFITTVLVVTIGSFVMKPVYRATAVIFVDQESPNILTTTGAVELQNQNYYSYREYYQSQAEILTSYSLLKKVFDDFNIKDGPDYKDVKDPLKLFAKTINVEPVRDTRLLKLNVDNKNPVMAADIANRIAELYVMRNLYYISKNEIMNLMKNEYLKLEAKMNEYAKIYKSAHPEMVKLKKEMDETVFRIEAEKSSVYNFDNIEEYARSDSKNALVGFKANNIMIQDLAVVPIKPIKPKKLLNIVLSVIFGLFGGIGIAFFLEYLDDSVRTVEELKKALKWPFLASVPHMRISGLRKEFDKDLLVHIKPKDPVSEVYRIIRTNILFSVTGNHLSQAILITSPGPQEGKTITICNSAIAMAQIGKRVLIVDADMRKPRIHEAFRRSNEKGLSSILSGQAYLDDIIQKTDIENLSLISGGIIPPNPSELIGGSGMKDFIAAAKQKFDFIFFDTPPIAMLADAAILSSFTDGTILVVDSGKTSRRTLARIYHMIDNLKSRVLGMVLNKAPLRGNDYYYYSHYYGKKKVSA